MSDFRAVIALWPTLADFAEDIGVDANHARQMRRRNSVPDGYWKRLLEAAERRGFEQVTSDLLIRLAHERRESAA